MAVSLASPGCKVLTHLAKQGVEKFIDAQKKMLELAVEQVESTTDIVSEEAQIEQPEPQTSWAEVTQKSVENIVTAEKSLLDLAVKPVKAARETGERAKAPRRAKRTTK